MNCESCRWWGDGQQWQVWRECKRHAPTLMVRVEFPNTWHGDGEPQGVWPKTQGADMCGDWTSKETVDNGS